MEIIIALIISSLIGLAIGQTRGRSGAGLFFGFLLGPIGWLLILIGPNPKKELDEKKKQALLNQQLAMQQAQLNELKKLQALQGGGNPSAPPLPMLGGRERIRVARGDEDLGEIPLSEAKRMLEAGELTLDDFYLDTSCNEWLELAGHPTLYPI